MDLVSTAQACELLGYPPPYIFRKIDEGALLPLRQDGTAWVKGKRLFFERADVLALKEMPPEPDGREWLSVEDAAAFLGIDRMSVFRLGQQGKLTSRKLCGPTRNGRRSYEFTRESVEARKAHMVSTPPPEENAEWMPIAEAMKALKMTRCGVKRRMKMGLLDSTHFGPAEAEALYVSRAQVEEQILDRPSYARRTEPQQFQVSERDIIWAAGFFDGEGSIGIALVNHRTHCLRISLSNSCHRSIRKLHACAGGFVYDRPRQQVHYRDQLRWQCHGDEAAAILKRIRPDLEAKAPQADLAIEFQERLHTHNYGRWDRMPPEEFEWREAQKERISRLNRPNVPPGHPEGKRGPKKSLSVP